MAHMNQVKKAMLAPAIKAVLKKYGMKGTIGVRHHSALVVNIKSGKLDIIGNYCDQHEELVWKRGYTPLQEKPTHLPVNYCWIDEHYTGTVAKFLTELKAAMMVGNHDRSDSMTDYFDVGWYIDINIGQWDKPYILEA